MKRLTKAMYTDCTGIKMYIPTYKGSDRVALIKASTKLGRIEDIEEQLGMRADQALKIMLDCKNKYGAPIDKVMEALETIFDDGDDQDGYVCPFSAYGFVPDCCNEETCRDRREKCWEEWYMTPSKKRYGG